MVAVGATTGRADLGFVVGVIMRLHETLLVVAGMVALSLLGFSPARLPTRGAAGADAMTASCSAALFGLGWMPFFVFRAEATARRRCRTTPAPSGFWVRAQPARSWRCT